MILGPDVFSLRDITEDEASSIEQMWDSGDGQFTGDFVETGGRPLLHNSNPYLAYFLKSAQNAVGDSITSVDVQGSRAAFEKGALVYASVFGYVHRASSLPVVDDAIREIGRMDTQEFMFATLDGMDKGLRFCRLLGHVLPAIEVNPRLEDVARVGAGALHLVMQASEREAMKLADFEVDPGLAELRELFSRDFGV